MCYLCQRLLVRIVLRKILERLLGESRQQLQVVSQENTLTRAQAQMSVCMCAVGWVGASNSQTSWQENFFVPYGVGARVARPEPHQQGGRLPAVGLPAVGGWIDGVQCVLSPAASRGVRSPAAPSMPMLASARALRSARDTGRVSMPCPSTEGARRPMDKSAFIAAIFSPREAGVCGDARLPRAEEMW